MRTLLAVGLAVLAAAVAMPAAAQGNPQQERMKVCNEKAAGKSGDERKKFMSECLKN